MYNRIIFLKGDKMKNNFASIRVAIRNGMKKIDQIVKHYYNLDLVHDVYCIHNFKQKRNEENNNGI